jgi:Terminase large subunit, T4likevirus-type, N-terminal
MELRLKRAQSMVFMNRKRFKVLVAGRRFGKSTLALWWLIVKACSQPGSLSFYVAPTCRQAKRIAWRLLKNLLSPGAYIRVSEEELLVELLNGAIVQLHGANDPDSLRGVGLDSVVLDEFASMKPETWFEVLRPALSDRNGEALFISTPCGFNALYDLYMAAKSNPHWATFRFTTAEGGYVREGELAQARSEMDLRRFRQEYEGSFEALAMRVYYAFDRDRNVTPLSISPNVALLVGMDFNVSPMTAVVLQKIAGQCHVIDEIVLPNSNTSEMMAVLNDRYPGHHGIVHPDPTGNSRRTNAPVGQTDFTLIEKSGWSVFRAHTCYPVVDRTNTVNARLCDANGQRTIFISPKCQHLIKALDTLTYKGETKIPDKRSGMDHITDALGYAVDLPPFSAQRSYDSFLFRVCG